MAIKPPAAFQIEVLLKGGLGNQLFQFANGISISYKQKIPVKFRFQNGDRVFSLDTFGISQGVSYIPELIAGNLQLRPWAKRRHLFYERFVEGSYSFAEIPVFTRNTRIDGYFQSFRYFQELDKEIISFIRRNLPNVVIPEHDIALHIRRGDYAKNPSFKKYHGLLEESYYRKGIDRLGISDPRILVFTDDAVSTREDFRDLFLTHDVQISSNSNPLIDLKVMTESRNLIIANSTFGWWAAKLNFGTIIAPSDWFASGPIDFVPSDLLPPAWIRQR